MRNKVIPFNKPTCPGNESKYIDEVINSGRLSGGGSFTNKCEKWLEKFTGTTRALLTNSCTSALELSALLLDIKPGDEIIVPSFTFVSTANPFVLRGAVPVFVDIRPDTLNIDETLILDAINENTRAIVPVHYAGISCEMNYILKLAKDSKIAVVEDAAQCLGATYFGQALGCMGDMGAYSFHDTKNIIAGECGTLLINNDSLVEQAEVIWEKGTDRKKFINGEVDKYSWQTHGSSFLPSEVTAAILLAQLERADVITRDRVAAWVRYHELLLAFEMEGSIRRPYIPDGCQHNGHIYYILLGNSVDRRKLMEFMLKKNIYVTFHFVPLHTSPAGKYYGRQHGNMNNTEEIAESIIRLPIWHGISESEQCYVVETLMSAISSCQQ